MIIIVVFTATNDFIILLFSDVSRVYCNVTLG